MQNRFVHSEQVWGTRSSRSWMRAVAELALLSTWPAALETLVATASSRLLASSRTFRTSWKSWKMSRSRTGESSDASSSASPSVRLSWQWSASSQPSSRLHRERDGRTCKSHEACRCVGLPAQHPERQSHKNGEKAGGSEYKCCFLEHHGGRCSEKEGEGKGREEFEDGS